MKGENNHSEDLEGLPPFFSTWNQLYLFVLVLHALIIALFWFFTRAYS